MGLTISSLFTQLFGKKQMRILMGKIDNPSSKISLPYLGLVLSGWAWVLDLYFGRELSGAGVVINDVYVDVR